MKNYKEVSIENYCIQELECRCNDCNNQFSEYTTLNYELVCFERVYKGNATCAEDIVFRGLGGNTNANIIMTSAIRPRNNEVMPVCTRCQTKYPVNQFVKGTTFQ